MRPVFFALISILFIIIESAFVSMFPMEFFKPDLGIPIIIYASLFIGPQSGFAIALLVGLFQEILSNAPAGSMLFTKISIYLIISFLRGQLFIDSKYSFSYICVASVAGESILFILLSLFSRGEIKNAFIVLFYILPNAIFTGFVSVYIFSLLDYINARFIARE